LDCLHFGTGFQITLGYVQNMGRKNRKAWVGPFLGMKDIAEIAKLLGCLHDQNKSGFSGGPAFIQPIRAI